MLKRRAVSFPLLLGLVALIFCWEKGGKYIYMFCAPLAVGMAVFEAGAMLKNAGTDSFPRAAGVIAGLAVLLLCVLGSTDWIGGNTLERGRLIAVPVLSVLPALLFFLFRKPGTLKRLLGTLGVLMMFGVPFWLTAAVFFFVLPLPLFPFLSAMPVTTVPALLFLLLVTKATDTGGYIFGMLSGKFLPGGNHKIAPSISPKKSYEGLAGGMLLSVLAALCFYWYDHAVGLTWSITAGVVLSLGSFFGDLTESALKRICGVKDSGAYIPGMGGAFDVLDSFIYNGALFFLLYLNLAP